MQVRLLLGVVTAGVVLLVPASAAVGGGSGRAALTPTERAALKIVSVKADGAEGAGLMVTVTFAGNIEKALGRGNLETGLVAMILEPKTAGFATADLATTGPGPIGRTLVKTHSTDVGVSRSGRQIRFFIGGPGASNVGVIKVKAFASSPVRTSARRTASAGVTPAEWEKIESATAADEQEVANALATVSGVDCASLRRMQASTEVALTRARDWQSYLDKLRTYIDKSIKEVDGKIGLHADIAVGVAHTIAAPIGLALTVLNGKTPARQVESWKDLLRSLKLDRKLVDVYVGRNQKLIDNLNLLKGKIASLQAIKCRAGGQTPSPPLLEKIHAVFDQDTYSTVYTEDAKGEDLKYEWSVSIPTDKDCAKGFHPNTPEENQATWYHADKSQRPDGPCNHDSLHKGLRGHPGTVSVRVANRLWACKATYDGTEGDNGSPEGDGAQPPGPGSCDRVG